MNTEQQVREHVVNTAREWLGFSEADGRHKQIIDLYNTQKPLPRSYPMKYSDAWCAAFVTAVAVKLGYTDIIQPECGCWNMVELYKKLNRWMENDAYVPEIGDIIFYNWADGVQYATTDNISVPDHVGIVSAITGNNFTVIEGNYSKSVKERSMKVNGQFIRGFGLPEYSKKIQAITPEPPKISLANDEIIWNFLISKGLNDFAVAGIMGNLFAESGLIPNNLQNSYEKTLGMTDAQYTAAVDNGTYSNFVRDSAGYGLAQWTFWSRKQALYDFSQAAGKSIGDLTMQLDFLWKELQGYSQSMNVLKTAKSILEASNIILMDFERPADMGEKVQATRAGYGQRYYDKYASPVTTPEPESPETQEQRKLIEDVTAKGLLTMSDYWYEVISGQTVVSPRNVQYLIEKALNLIP